MSLARWRTGWWAPRWNTNTHIHKYTNTKIQMLLHPGGPPRHRGRLLPAGRGRRPQPEHQGVQPSPLLVAAFKGIPERSSQRDSWKHEVLIDDYKKHIKDHFNRKNTENHYIIDALA